MSRSVKEATACAVERARVAACEHARGYSWHYPAAAEQLGVGRYGQPAHFVMGELIRGSSEPDPAGG